MSTELIRYDRAQFAVLPPDEAALELVNQVLNRLASVPCEIDTPAEQERAVIAQRETRTLLRDIEAARKAAKEPVLGLAKQIDDAAKALVAEVVEEDTRVSQAVGAYQFRMAEIARKAARERAEAEAKLEAEKQAELERINAEALALAKEMRTLIDANKLAADLQRVHDLAKQNAEAVLPPVVAPQKVEGQIVREVWCHEVTDIHALYRANPGLVELKPRAREINELLARGMTGIPGLRTWKETRASARAIPTQKALDV